MVERAVRCTPSGIQVVRSCVGFTQYREIRFDIEWGVLERLLTATKGTLVQLLMKPTAAREAGSWLSMNEIWLPGENLRCSDIRGKYPATFIVGDWTGYLELPPTARPAPVLLRDKQVYARIVAKLAKKVGWNREQKEAAAASTSAGVSTAVHLTPMATAHVTEEEAASLVVTKSRRSRSVRRRCEPSERTTVTYMLASGAGPSNGVCRDDGAARPATMASTSAAATAAGDGSMVNSAAMRAPTATTATTQGMAKPAVELNAATMCATAATAAEPLTGCMTAPAATAPSAAIAANGVMAAAHNAAMSTTAVTMMTANGGSQVNAPTASTSSAATWDPMAAMLGVPAAELAEWRRNLATLAPLMNLLRLSTSAPAAAQPDNNGGNLQ